ncbi:MAG: hypothetical protein M5U12_08590 [Verrucomicrobia bacterium]|nr:hypothetical protein [Verrucomicrobiota bacterium]
MLADSKPGDGSSAKPTRGLFDANIDPTTPAEWPSNRHNRRTVVMFCDGHAESPPAQRRHQPGQRDVAPALEQRQFPLRLLDCQRRRSQQDGSLASPPGTP